MQTNERKPSNNPLTYGFQLKQKKMRKKNNIYLLASNTR